MRVFKQLDYDELVLTFWAEAKLVQVDLARTDNAKYTQPKPGSPVHYKAPTRSNLSMTFENKKKTQIKQTNLRWFCGVSNNKLNANSTSRTKSSLSLHHVPDSCQLAAGHEKPAWQSTVLVGGRCPGG
ncbi:hypothetical protein BDW60DRAFT_13887 [Aspergillus nidulans var. acristatus]|jgi:hypothetical protein